MLNIQGRKLGWNTTSKEGECHSLPYKTVLGQSCQSFYLLLLTMKLFPSSYYLLLTLSFSVNGFLLSISELWTLPFSVQADSWHRSSPLLKSILQSLFATLKSFQVIFTLWGSRCSFSKSSFGCQFLSGNAVLRNSLHFFAFYFWFSLNSCSKQKPYFQILEEKQVFAYPVFCCPELEQNTCDNKVTSFCPPHLPLHCVVQD